MNDSHQQPRLDRVQGADEIEEVAALATEIWNEHFPSIIGQAQVDYMLRKFQSVDAIHRQIGQQRYEYFLVGRPGSRAGYFAIVPLEEERSMQLSKLYLRRGARGRGLGGRIVEWLEAQCRSRGLDKLWLTVNKDNRASIDFYERAGFKTESASIFDIGDGFIMDDYVMAKPIVVDEP
jgi:ribosomal protein S18 acetylase RimI-like enzyme